MAAIDDYNLAENLTFRSKVDTLMRKAAIAISSEAVTAQNPVAAANKRSALCQRIFFDNDRKIEYMFSKALASQGTLAVDSEDDAIYDLISSIFSGMAGVTWTDLQPV